MAPRRTRRDADLLRPDARWNRLAPWPVVAALGGVGAAVVGWCMCAAGCLLGWLQATQIPVSQPLRLAAQLWLAGQFSAVDVQGSRLSIAPLGLTLVLVVVGSGAATLAVQHCFDVAPPAQQRGRWFVRIGGVFTVAYVIAVGFAAEGFHATTNPVRTLGGCLVIGVVMAFAGVARALG
ncbi:MAG: DUF6350 family protein, partial [Propionibacteriaceae bacterium]|nr:DUF6350 family protein [Propionibacteriaceae bacterium]